MDTLKFIRMILRTSLLICLIFTIPTCAQRELSSSTTKKVLEIIKDPVLWNESFIRAIAQMEAIRDIEQQYIEIFPSVLLSTERYPTSRPDLVQRKIEGFNRAIGRSQNSDLYKALSQSIKFSMIESSASIYRITDTDSLAASISYQGSQPFFNQALKITTVVERIGRPQATTTKVIHGRGEERPQILTQYSYADGIIVFVMADIAPQPGVLYKVILDVPRLVTALKSELR